MLLDVQLSPQNQHLLFFGSSPLKNLDPPLSSNEYICSSHLPIGDEPNNQFRASFSRFLSVIV